jgi:sugar phosphate permease
LLLARRVDRSPTRRVAFDRYGQISAITAMTAVTYGVIEAGAIGFTAPRVVGAFVLAALALVAFIVAEARVPRPMVPPDLFRSRNARIAVAIGFAFVVCYYGLPFVMSLYLQQVRGLSPFTAGLAFLPMMVSGALLTPSSARLVERVGVRHVITTGLAMMALGLLVLALLPTSTPVWVLAVLMVLVGLAGPLVSPPATALLVNSVPDHRVGTAGGVFNTSRQLGGALAVAVFGTLLGGRMGFVPGFRLSLVTAAMVAAVAAVASRLLRPVARLQPLFHEGAP